MLLLVSGLYTNVCNLYSRVKSPWITYPIATPVVSRIKDLPVGGCALFWSQFLNPWTMNGIEAGHVKIQDVH